MATQRVAHGAVMTSGMVMGAQARDIRMLAGRALWGSWPKFSRANYAFRQSQGVPTTS